MAAFNIFNNMDDSSDEDEDEDNSTTDVHPKDITNVLPNVSNPEGATPQLDDQQRAVADIIAAKQKMRTGKAPMGNPAQEAGLSQPWYSPDAIAAGVASGPIEGGLSKAASSAISPEIKAASIAAKNRLMASLGKQVAGAGDDLLAGFLSGRKDK